MLMRCCEVPGATLGCGKCLSLLRVNPPRAQPCQLGVLAILAGLCLALLVLVLATLQKGEE